MDSKMQKVANIIGYLIGGILISPNDRDVEEGFTKRLELLGGTIEDPND